MTPDSQEASALHYDAFFGPTYFEPYAKEVAKRIDPKNISVALELAAGTGRVTHHIREHIPPTAILIASDISENMLDIARKKFGHLAIDWQIIDAQQLPQDDNTIDLVVCCFGYMFVPNKKRTFAEAYRVLKSDGQFLFTTWDTLESNAASYTYRSIAENFMNKPFPESSNDATSMSDETEIMRLLNNTGFTKHIIEKAGLQFICPTAKQAAEGFVNGDSMLEEIKKSNSSVIEEIKKKLELVFTEKFGAEPMIAPMSAFICHAWKD